jgi:competence protein ComEC
LWTALGYSTLSRRWRTLITVAVLAVYTLLVGAPASALRGFLFSVFFLAAPLVGRPRDLSTVVAVVAAALLALRPAAATDLGFQLSFLAVGGIVFGVPILRDSLRRVRVAAIRDRWSRIARHIPADLRRSTGDLATSSVAATIATAPVIAASFGTLSVVAVPTNVLVLPLVVLATPALIATAFAAALHPTLGVAVGFAPAVLIALMIGIVRVFSALPFAQIVIPPLHPAVLCMFSGILFFTVATLWNRLPPLRRAVFADDGS